MSKSRDQRARPKHPNVLASVPGQDGPLELVLNRRQSTWAAAKLAFGFPWDENTGKATKAPGRPSGGAAASSRTHSSFCLALQQNAPRMPPSRMRSPRARRAFEERGFLAALLAVHRCPRTPEPSLEASHGRTFPRTLGLGQVKGEGLVVPSGVLEALDRQNLVELLPCICSPDDTMSAGARCCWLVAGRGGAVRGSCDSTSTIEVAGARWQKRPNLKSPIPWFD